MEPLSGFKTMMLAVEEQARRDERAAVLRLLRRERDYYRLRGNDIARAIASEMVSLADYIGDRWHIPKGFEGDIGRTNLESDSSPTEGSIRREGTEGGPFPGT